MNTLTSHLVKTTTGDYPEWGSPEFTEWWESQYAPAESLHVGNIEYVTGSSLELNKIFWELEEESFAYGAETIGK